MEGCCLGEIQRGVGEWSKNELGMVRERAEDGWRVVPRIELHKRQLLIQISYQPRADQSPFCQRVYIGQMSQLKIPIMLPSFLTEGKLIPGLPGTSIKKILKIKKFNVSVFPCIHFFLSKWSKNL